ncbi:MAG: hypothetical protein JXB88_00310, partial [Spirochaetales bacterium]|nr:hypothetical protein [Spirochaetales bacterium]
MSMIIEKNHTHLNVNEKKQLLIELIEKGSRLSIEHQSYPLLDIQESFLIGKQIGKYSDFVGCHAYLEIEQTHLDIERLNNAWHTLMNRHEMLHTIILPEGKQKRLEFFPFYSFNVYDLSGNTEEQKNFFLLTLRERMSHKVYLPQQWPLFEITIVKKSGIHYTIHFSIDEWIADFASIEILMKEWYALYTDPGTRLEKLEFTFKNYVHYVIKNNVQERNRTDVDYWMNKMKNLHGGPLLPVKENPVRGEGKSYFKRKRLEYLLENALFENLRKISRENKITMTILFLVLFSEVLNKWSKSSSFSLIMTFFNRMP